MALLALALGLGLAGCGGSNDAGGASGPSVTAPTTGPRVDRVFSLDLAPGGGDLLVGTDVGIFRLPSGGGTPHLQPAQVAGPTGPIPLGAASLAVTDDGEILTAGHPLRRTKSLPESLGVIASRDARAWRVLSLYGEVDFHPLRARGGRLYGFDLLGLRIMTSGDGVQWSQHPAPGPVFDLVPDPRDDTHLVASTDQGLVESRDDGATWRPLAQTAEARLAWASSGTMYIAEPDGTVAISSDGGVSSHRVGTLGGRPQQIDAEDDGSLYAARDGGAILRSRDGGASWTEIARLRTR